MRLQDTFRQATASLLQAKTRSLLTMLGIIIGISSVITLMSIGQSAQNLIIGQIKGVGSNLVFVIPGNTNGGKFSAPAAAQGIIIKTLVQADVDALRREPSIRYATGEVRGAATIVYGDNSVNVTYQGASADIFPIQNFETSDGYPYTEADVAGYGHVVVIGSKLATTLFGAHEPVGKFVRLGPASFRVIGVLAPKGVGPFGVDEDNLVLMPISVAGKQLAGISYLNTILLETNDTYDTDFVKSRISSVLRADHGIHDPNKDDFTIETQADVVSLLGNITSILTLFLTSIAAISLVVGGIGIMNIMMVAVVERTREIGLRKALGATEADILQQFLFEAMVLTFLGGIVGIIIGAVFVTLLWLVLSHTTTIGWTFALPLSAIIISVVVSTITGIVFGLYPARQAAKKSPIEALRYE